MSPRPSSPSPTALLATATRCDSARNFPAFLVRRWLPEMRANATDVAALLDVVFLKSYRMFGLQRFFVVIVVVPVEDSTTMQLHNM